MNKFAKIAAIAAAALATTPAFAAPVGPSGGNPNASARIIKPLTLTATGELDFGTIVMNGVSATRTVTVNPDGSVTRATELVCDLNGTAVAYNVRGTQGQVVYIELNTSTLIGSNGGSLTLTPNSDQTAEDANTDRLTLANSGAPGSDFNVGGSIDIDAATIDGVYTGTVDVEVQYN